MARFTGADGGNNGGAALNYVQVVGTPQTISSAPNSVVDLNITTTGKPVQISVTGEGANASAGSWLRLNLFRDNVEIGNAIQMESSAASENVPFAINFIDDIQAGTYNYSARVTTINGGSWTFGEAAGPVINAVELTGFKGDRGLRGLTGDAGADGAAGASAYDIAVENGFTGTEQEWLTSLEGSGGTADIADFVFTTSFEEGNNPGDDTSTMTVHNHDMEIRTTRDDAPEGSEGPYDADISISSADDIWMDANDEIRIAASNGQIDVEAMDDSVYITSYGSREEGDSGNTWEFGHEELVLPNDIVIADNASTQTGSATQTLSITQVAFGSSGSMNNAAIYMPLSETASWMKDNFYNASEATITFADNTIMNLISIHTGNVEGMDVIIFQFSNTSLDFTIPATVSVTATITSYNKNFKITMQNQQENGNVEWTFSNDGVLFTPTGDAAIVNAAAPGSLILSAYNGVEIEFADVEGAGLKFPDNTVQTTAYTGTDSANHGDFYFDESTLRVESSSMTIEANEGDGTVASQIKLTAGDMPIDIASYEQDSTLFGTVDWSTAEWQSDGNGAGQIVITGSTGIIDFLNTSFNGSFQKITVNNEFISDYAGGSYGGDAATLYVSTGPEGGTPVTITTLTFTWSNKSGITIDYDDQEMNIIANNMQLNIDSTGNEDININASDDLRLESGDDMFLRSNGYINFVSSADNNNYEWRMESNGTLEFPARGRLRNPGSSSGDGNGYDTFEIIPDFSRYEYDQYLIVDPTQPNHIHIRPGGAIDYSNAELILGGELNHVNVNDGSRSVSIKTRITDHVNSYINENNVSNQYFVTTNDAITTNGVVNVDGLDYAVLNEQYDSPNPGQKTLEISGGTFTAGQNYTFRVAAGENDWQFTSNGFLTGPAMGYVNVYGIANPATDTYLGINSSHKVTISGTDGEFLGDPEVANNQIATIGDINNLASGEVSFTVNGGSLGTMPTFDGAPLFSGTYVKTGPMVHFQIQVDMDNILTFGDGQYFIDLPFPAKYGYQFKEGCLHDISSGKQYAIGGHVYAGQSQMALTFTNSAGQDDPFDFNSPVTLSTADNFHISGTYITN